MLTKFKWTVYLDGVLFDVMTDEEVEVLVGQFKVQRIDAETGLIEF